MCSKRLKYEKRTLANGGSANMQEYVLDDT